MNRVDHLPRADYERTDASPAPILVTGALLLLCLGVVLASASAVYRSQAGPGPLRNRVEPADFSAGPEQRTGIALDWAEQDRLVREHLTTYGWINRPAGVVRIPIDRALALVAAESKARRPEEQNP